MIRRGLESVGFGDTFWRAVFMLFSMSILPLTDSFISTLNCCVTSAISGLNDCRIAAKSASVHNSASQPRFSFVSCSLLFLRVFFSFSLSLSLVQLRVHFNPAQNTPSYKHLSLAQAVSQNRVAFDTVAEHRSATPRVETLVSLQGQAQDPPAAAAAALVSNASLFCDMT